MTLLSMRGIGKEFAGVPVLEGVDFDLRAGEVHVLAGENGAGKSTLIKIIGGVHAPDAGSVEVGAHPVSFRSPRDAERSGIAVIHQELSLVGTMSVADNLFLGREPLRAGLVVDRAAERRRAGEVFRRLSLDVDPDRAVGEYPIAVQQMVEIAKALEKGARIIVMDEPTSALSDPEIARLFEMVRGLRARACGIVYITHKMAEIYAIADRITVLRDGRMVGRAAARDLPPDALVRWMVGRDTAMAHERRGSPPGSVRLAVDGFCLRDPRGTGRMAVDDVSLRVRAGQILGVAGLQGSGASELLNGLFGVHGAPERGRVLLDGEAVTIRSPRESVRRGLALLTNDRKAGGLVLPMSVAHNITLATLPALAPGGWLRPRREAAWRSSSRGCPRRTSRGRSGSRSARPSWPSRPSARASRPRA
jgi:ABC-type sugar transport system ATPase subunit